MTRTEAYFSVVGVEPAPQGSKRYLGNGRFIEASTKLEPWRKAVAEAVQRMFVATGSDEMFAPDEPLEVWVTFILPKPKTVKRIWPVKPPDTDKLQRSLGDSISLERYAHLVPDDSQIVKWHSEKVYGSTDDMGCRVAIKLASPPGVWVSPYV